MESLENRALALAKNSFYPTVNSSRGRILFPEKAVFSYPDFDPCKNVQILIRVDIPALIHMAETTFTFSFTENDING